MKSGKSISWLVMFTVFLNLFTFAGPASACSCLPPLTVEDAFDDADAVFYAKVVRTTYLLDLPGLDSLINSIGRKLPQNISSSLFNLRVTMDVSKSWKGVREDEVLILTHPSEPACGKYFQVKENYIVYAYEVADNFHTGLCTRTALVTSDFSNEDFAVLSQYREIPLQDADLFRTFVTGFLLFSTILAVIIRKKDM